ncbi:MAG: histidine kinase N-terminal 7TM domain-containing protein [Clostridia bacterium]|nr:integral membrane sensor signal transduction histidine kinase [Clostridium sp. CAG:798]
MQLLGNIYFLLLIFSTILIILLLMYQHKKKSVQQLRRLFTFSLICVLIICVGVLVQSIFSTCFDINPIYFENFIYIGSCFLPVALFFTALSFKNTIIKFKKIYLLLFIVPITTLIVLFTNNLHHAFYVHYSENLNEMVYGWYLNVHIIYTYGLMLLSVIIIIKSSFKISGFFSKQSLLIILGISVPLITNILGTLKIIPMTVYITPISFAFTMLCFTFAIFKFNFLGVAPIALQTIVNRISDSYLVLDENFLITDFNTTFLKTFGLTASELREQNVINFLKTHKKYEMNVNKLQKALDKVKNSTETIVFEQHFKYLNKYFTIEINSIFNKEVSLGILILFKDITQHKLDMKALKDNQDILVERERLASLGQLIGGIAHNLKSPIMSISGATEGLTDLIKEYEESIVDKDVTVEDHLAIASDMKDWISKIKSYLEYMSDIITAVKGQAVALSENTVDSFTVDELTKRVDILMKHELKKALITLNVKLEVDKSLVLHGNINGLVQVVNNMISNAIQAYTGKPNQDIDLIITQEKNNVIVSIKDYAGGLPEEVQEKLFKEMITTKGKDGTGIGLFMSYSNIRAHFNGDITYSTEKGKGTIFNIILPQ